MKTRNICEYTTLDILDENQIKKIFNYFTRLTNIEVSLYDTEGNSVLNLGNPDYLCPYAEKCSNICKSNMSFSTNKAFELGDFYIFKCGCGLIKCTIPIVFQEKLIGSISCGPIALWNFDEYAKKELQLNLDKLNLKNLEIDRLIKNIPQLNCKDMTDSANLLSIIVNYLCKEESKYLQQNLQIQLQQQKIAELLINKKKEKYIEKKDVKDNADKISKEIERHLMQSIQNGDLYNSEQILNDYLAEILLKSDLGIDFIKVKLYELSIMNLRAAVDAGAQIEEVSLIINDYIKSISNETDYPKICLHTTNLLENIITLINKLSYNKKNNTHLIKAMNYIADHYAENITLESVSKKVFVSNYYLSHLFSDQLKMTFQEYLTKTRMEASLELIKAGNYKIMEIAEMVGFNDSSYFAKVFRKYYGTVPQTYLLDKNKIISE